MFFFCACGSHRTLHSFPTRRSSDLFFAPDPVRRLAAEDDGQVEVVAFVPRSEEHTSELQSRLHLVCRLLLEKKKKSESRSAPEQCIARSLASQTTGLSPRERAAPRL